MIFDHLPEATFAGRIPMKECQVGPLSDHNSKGGWPTSWSIITLSSSTNPYSFYPRSSFRLGVIFKYVSFLAYFLPMSARLKILSEPVGIFLFGERSPYPLVQSSGQGRGSRKHSWLAARTPMGFHWYEKEGGDFFLHMTVYIYIYTSRER